MSSFDEVHKYLSRPGSLLSLNNCIISEITLSNMLFCFPDSIMTAFFIVQCPNVDLKFIFRVNYSIDYNDLFEEVEEVISSIVLEEDSLYTKAYQPFWLLAVKKLNGIIDPKTFNQFVVMSMESEKEDT